MLIRVQVPCSTSNLGSGFDCIGLAFNRYLTATLQIDDTPLKIERRGTLAALADVDDDLVLAAMRDVRCDARGTLVLDSDIPVGRGLGSSAAATIAGVMLASRLLKQDMSREMVAARATSIEGHPDNAVPSSFGGLMAAVLDDADRVLKVRIHRLRLSDRLRFVYAAPQSIVSTKAARRALPEQVPHAVAVRSLSRTVALLEGLADGDADLLRVGMTDELHVPYRLPMIPGGEAAIHAATEAGAFAATISGSGSGLIAICDRHNENSVIEAMRIAFRTATGSEAIAFAAEVDHAGARYIES
jgi:homoserine kinase